MPSILYMLKTITCYLPSTLSNRIAPYSNHRQKRAFRLVNSLTAVHCNTHAVTLVVQRHQWAAETPDHSHEYSGTHGCVGQSEVVTWFPILRDLCHDKGTVLRVIPGPVTGALWLQFLLLLIHHFLKTSCINYCVASIIHCTLDYADIYIADKCSVAAIPWLSMWLFKADVIVSNTCMNEYIYNVYPLLNMLLYLLVVSSPRKGGHGSRAVELAAVTPQHNTRSHVALQYTPVKTSGMFKAHSAIFVNGTAMLPKSHLNSTITFNMEYVPGDLLQWWNIWVAVQFYNTLQASLTR